MCTESRNDVYSWGFERKTGPAKGVIYWSRHGGPGPEFHFSRYFE